MATTTRVLPTSPQTVTAHLNLATRKLVVEFIGTFFLVFTVGTATAKINASSPVAPLAIGSALMVMIFAGGHISGGHYNPAVSTGVMIRGKLPREDWIPYMVIQLLAGVIGGLLASVVAGHQSAGSHTRSSPRSGWAQPTDGRS